MDNIHITGLIAEDATRVVFERVGNGDITRNGTALSNLLLHGILTRNGSILIDTVLQVLVGDKAGLTRVAVAADSHGRAFLTIVVATSHVDGAGLIGDRVLVHPLVGVVCITAVAALVSHLTGDDDLRGDVDIRPGSVASDLDAIREG